MVLKIIHFLKLNRYYKSFYLILIFNYLIFPNSIHLKQNFHEKKGIKIKFCADEVKKMRKFK